MEEESKELCCLCGSKIADTRDHVFPKCLFNIPRPTNLPTMPACKECNNWLSKDEEVFRVFLASGMAVESDAGKKIWVEQIRPDLRGKRSGLKQFIQDNVRFVKHFSNIGNICGYIPVLEVNRESVNRVIRKIAKGLYYLDTQHILPDEVKVLIGCYQENPGILSPPFNEAIKGAKKTELGNGKLTYWRNTVKDSPEESLTWIRFYKDQIFLICTTKQSIVNA